MESFEQIAEQYTPMIYSIMRRLTIYKNKEEFFQMGLIALWEAQQQFNPGKGSFTNYTYNHILGRYLDEFRRLNKEVEHTTIPAEEFWQYLIDESVSSLLDEETLLAYCQNGQLSENQTKWVLYTFLKGFDTNQIAEIECVSPSAVKHWKTKATERLRKTASLF